MIAVQKAYFGVVKTTHATICRPVLKDRDGYNEGDIATRIIAALGYLELGVVKL